MSQIEPKDVHVPRTDAETDSSTDDKVQAALRRYARRSAVGFAILILATSYVATIVSKTGCEGRRNTARTLDGIIVRLNEANKAQFEKGKITFDERQTARAFYDAESRRLVVPECTSLFTP